MTDATSIYGLRFYEDGDPPDLPDATQSLAQDVEDQLERIDADAAAGGKLYSTTYSGTTDASGFLTVTHGGGFTPVGGWAITTNPSASFAHCYGIDTIGGTTVRLRFGSITSNTAPASTAVQGRLFLLRP